MKAKCQVQQNGGSSNDSAELNTPKFPLQGPANILEALQAICALCRLQAIWYVQATSNMVCAGYKQYVQVQPHLEFAAPSWTPWLTGDKETLEDVQEKAVKALRSKTTRKDAPS